jgi:hypothetical protein
VSVRVTRVVQVDPPVITDHKQQHGFAAMA